MSKKKRNKRANGEGSIVNRSDGRWEGRYSLGFDPETGKQIRKSIYGKTQKEVHEKLVQIMSEISRNEYIEPSRMKLKDWLEMWVNEYSVDKRYSTLKGYKAQIKKHIAPALGNVYLEDLTPMKVQLFYNTLMKPDSNGRCLSAKSVKNVHIVFRAAMQQAVEIDLIKKNPCTKARLPRVYKTEIKPLSDAEIQEFIRLSQSDDIYGTVLRVILFTGLREAEALGLTWDCVDFHNGTILINKQLQRRPQSAGGTQLTPTKNGKSRVLRPARYVMQTLKQRYTEQVMQCMRAGDDRQAWHNEAEHKKALVFTNEAGRYLVAKRLYLHFKKLAEEAGAPDARVHDLRHTFAVISLQNGDDVKTVQTNLGHASASFTLDVYGHISDRMQRESADRMQQYINEISRTKNA